MPEFELVWEGQVREIYTTEAETAEQARANWPDNATLASSEAFDGEIVEVNEVN